MSSSMFYKEFKRFGMWLDGLEVEAVFMLLGNEALVFFHLL